MIMIHYFRVSAEKSRLVWELNQSGQQRHLHGRMPDAKGWLELFAENYSTELSYSTRATSGNLWSSILTTTTISEPIWGWIWTHRSLVRFKWFFNQARLYRIPCWVAYITSTSGFRPESIHIESVVLLKALFALAVGLTITKHATCCFCSDSLNSRRSRTMTCIFR
jgi:hypothetical protein